MFCIRFQELGETQSEKPTEANVVELLQDEIVWQKATSGQPATETPFASTVVTFTAPEEQQPETIEQSTALPRRTASPEVAHSEISRHTELAQTIVPEVTSTVVKESEEIHEITLVKQPSTEETYEESVIVTKRRPSQPAETQEEASEITRFRLEKKTAVSETPFTLEEKIKETEITIVRPAKQEEETVISTSETVITDKSATVDRTIEKPQDTSSESSLVVDVTEQTLPEYITLAMDTVCNLINIGTVLTFETETADTVTVQEQLERKPVVEEKSLEVTDERVSVLDAAETTVEEVRNVHAIKLIICIL